jgi:hypothetical protein
VIANFGNMPITQDNGFQHSATVAQLHNDGDA